MSNSFSLQNANRLGVASTSVNVLQVVIQPDIHHYLSPLYSTPTCSAVSFGFIFTSTSLTAGLLWLHVCVGITVRLPRLHYFIVSASLPVCSPPLFRLPRPSTIWLDHPLAWQSSTWNDVYFSLRGTPSSVSSRYAFNLSKPQLTPRTCRTWLSQH